MEIFRVPKGQPWPVHLTPIMHEIEQQAERHKVKVIVQMDRADRSEEQNKLIWALYSDIIRLGGEAMGGWTKDDLHEFFLGQHFGWEVVNFFGQKRKRPIRRSSKLDKQEFSEYVEFILRFMAEQGVFLEAK